jgi:prepilin-type N-terminal cleavage/methylation domain-containing protein
MMHYRQQCGLTLVEVLVSIVLLGILLVPAIRALQTGVVGSAIHNNLATDHFRLSSRVEELIAAPFADLVAAATAAGDNSTPTTYSEAPGPGRLIVYLSFYDGDNEDQDDNSFTGGDTDLMWIRVSAEGTVFDLQTVVAQGL